MIESRHLLGLGCILFAFHAGANPSPYQTDLYGQSLSPEDTVCGSDKMLAMNHQDDRLKQMGSPVAVLKIQTAGGTAFCTGTMISADLMLTAGHCQAPCETLSATFGYLDGARKSRSETFACRQIVEIGGSNYNEDYMILSLEGSPGTAWGFYQLADPKLTPGQSLLLIHHPRGTPMKVSRDCAYQGENGGMLFHRCDTEPGSSGAAIMVPDYDHPERTKIVGVHTLGGCSADLASANSGPFLHQLSLKSETLRNLMK